MQTATSKGDKDDVFVSQRPGENQVWKQCREAHREIT